MHASYLERLATANLALIDADIAAHADDPSAATRAIFAAIAADVARPTFRGCAFNNASIEFDDPEHPARVVARHYRAALHERLAGLGEVIAPGRGEELGSHLALIVDGMYVNAAHLGRDGPAAAGPALAAALVEAARD